MHVGVQVHRLRHHRLLNHRLNVGRLHVLQNWLLNDWFWPLNLLTDRAALNEGLLCNRLRNGRLRNGPHDRLRSWLGDFNLFGLNNLWLLHNLLLLCDLWHYLRLLSIERVFGNPKEPRHVLRHLLREYIVYETLKCDTERQKVQRLLTFIQIVNHNGEHNRCLRLLLHM